MKDYLLTVTECHPPRAAPPDQIIRRTVTAWLTKELRKSCASGEV